MVTKPTHRRVRPVKPCSVDGCPKLIQITSVRCLTHHNRRLVALQRERYAGNPGRPPQLVAGLVGGWLREEDRLIRLFSGNETAEEIGRRCERESSIRRTAAAVKHRASYIGVSLARAMWAIGDLEKVFGVSAPTIHVWIDADQLESKPWGQWLRVSSESQIEAFIRGYPWLYDLDRMAGGQFKRLAEVVQKRDPWWNTERAVKEAGHGVYKELLRKLRADGLIEAHPRPGRAVMYRAAEIMSLGEVLKAWRARVRAQRTANLIPGAYQRWVSGKVA